jgi:nicotinamide mononucleotide transporter
VICTWLEAHGSSCLEAAGFVFGVVNVWLATRENVLSWPTGIVNAAMYTVVFARAGLYSDTGLQVVYLLLSVYGWYAWVRGGPSQAPLVVTRTPRRSAGVIASLAVGTWLLLWLITARIPGAALAPLDAALVAASLAAQFMMTRKYRECWLLWIVTDIAYVAMFAWKGLTLTSILYGIFTILAIKGHREWTRSFERTSRASS